jgi:DNA polymerase elongation subunit (family B)
MKILMLDTEFLAPSGFRGNLKAELGLMYCMCAKWYGEKKVHTYRLDSYNSDLFKAEKRMLKDMKKLLEEADVWVTWYGSKCDIPFINTKLIEHGMSPLPNTKHLDLWRVCKQKLLLGSNAMGNVARWLKFDEQKTPLEFKTWYRALHGNKKAFNYIVTHCVADIKVLEEAYVSLLPLISVMPNVNLVSGNFKACPKCGTEGKIQKRGFNYAHVTRTQRFQCTACGSWLKGKPERMKGIEVR